jgi:ABC-type multidrug transport system fused ATPase/permease subunit
LIVILSFFKVFEEIIFGILPIFLSLMSDALLCRQQIFDSWTKYNASSDGPISQAAYEARLNTDGSFCFEELPVSLGINCCLGNAAGENDQDQDVSSIFRVFVPLIAPNMRNNFHGFSRVQDLILVQVYFTLVSETLKLFQGILNDIFSLRFQGGLQRRVFDAFLAQDMGFFDARPTGVLLSRIMNDSGGVQGVAAIVAIIVKIIIRIMLSVAVAYQLNPSLFYLFLSLIPLEFVIVHKQGAFSRFWLLVANTRSGKHYQVMQEIFDKVKHIKVFNGIEAAVLQFSNSLQLNYRIQAYTSYVSNFGFGMFLSLYRNIFSCSLQYISARLILQLPNAPNSDVRPFSAPKLFSWGMYSVFLTYASNVKGSIAQFYALYQEVNKVMVMGQTMVYYLYRKPVGGSEKTQGSGFVSKIEHVDPTIRFENVSFSYPSRPGVAVLKQFSATFPANKFSCIIGNSGGGKSTTMSLILRMYEPSSGKIWFGKHEYNSMNLTFLRECFAYVTQEPVMFSCTIRENLLYANPMANEDQIQKALEDAGCKSIITALPDGLETKLAGDLKLWRCERALRPFFSYASSQV